MSAEPPSGPHDLSFVRERQCQFFVKRRGQAIERIRDDGETAFSESEAVQGGSILVVARPEVQKIAEDKLRPVNPKLALTGSVMHFSEFMITTYVPTYCRCR